MLKLNLGSGNLPIDGYVNIDLADDKDVYPLEYTDNSVDEIRASHILEHFSHREIYNVLKHWTAKLKPGGLMKIAVPDFRKIVEPYVRGEKTNAVKYVMGGQVNDRDFHKSIFDKETLATLMDDVGLGQLKIWQSEINDCAGLPISLNIQGIKGQPQTVQNRNIWSKIWAICSMPRLCFTANQQAMLKTYTRLLSQGMEADMATGVFWGQVLSREIDKRLNDGIEWILTLDYDSWFVPEHVLKLYELIEKNSHVDAIVPIQTQRNNLLPLFGMGRTKVDISRFQRPLTQIETGHFGLTLIRASAIKKMAKPWFWAQPDPNGGWGKGRTDEDIWFWQKFAEAGNCVYLANEVSIGHLQVVCSFPGKLEDNWKPIHVYMNDLEEKGPPPHCVPQIEVGE